MYNKAIGLSLKLMFIAAVHAQHCKEILISVGFSFQSVPSCSWLLPRITIYSSNIARSCLMFNPVVLTYITILLPFYSKQCRPTPYLMLCIRFLRFTATEGNFISYRLLCPRTSFNSPIHLPRSSTIFFLSAISSLSLLIFSILSLLLNKLPIRPFAVPSNTSVSSEIPSNSPGAGDATLANAIPQSPHESRFRAISLDSAILTPRPESAILSSGSGVSFRGERRRIKSFRPDCQSWRSEWRFCPIES